MKRIVLAAQDNFEQGCVFIAMHRRGGPTERQVGSPVDIISPRASQSCISPLSDISRTPS
jgi:hypothetical protein